MDIFAVVADPIRRDILALLANQPAAAGVVAEAFRNISRPAVSRHLRVLREAGLVRAQTQGRQQIYATTTQPLSEVTEWIEGFWSGPGNRLDALETEVYRTRRDRITSDSQEEALQTNKEQTA